MYQSSSGVTPKRMRGLSLVELMVALTVGLLLLAGVFQIYLGNRESYTTQQSVSLAQESGRFSTIFITRVIRQAGYVTSYVKRAGNVYTDISPPIEGEENGDDPDTITLRYQGSDDGQVLDCFGQPVPVDLVVENKFFIQTSGPNNTSNLFCQRRIYNPAITPSVYTDELVEPLVQGVINMQVIYGVDGTTNGKRDTSSYVNANAIPDWRQIRSVSLRLRIGDDPNLGDKIFSTSVAIRNRLDDA